MLGLEYFVVAFLAVVALSFPCPLASTVDIQGTLIQPQVPTISVENQATLLKNYTLITDHWSEVAKMQRPKQQSTTQYASNCPHLNTANLKNWHDSSIWPNNQVPSADGSAITLPSGISVLVSACSFNPNNVYGIITIPSTSALIFGDTNITLLTNGIKVNGKLQIGSPTCRLLNNIEITLYGSRNDQTLPASPEVKGIYATAQGSIDIHGAKYFPTWTRLSRTAIPGDKIIFIQDLVNWQIGMKIFITTTELKDARDWHRNEVFTITGLYTVSGFTTQTAVQLNQSLLYTHYGGSEYQAEVGLLTRNIVIQGDPINSEPIDQSPILCNETTSSSTYVCPNKYLTGFGGHVMINGATASGRVSGVEFYRMGSFRLI